VLLVFAPHGLVVIMAKRKSATTSSDDEKTVDIVHVLLPIYEAHLLLGIACDLEDDERYAERAKALITASRHHVDAAFKLIENIRDRGGRSARKRSTS